MRLGLMNAASTGVDVWRRNHPTYDGRGVIVAILDSGVDPGVAGLLTTSTGEPKLLDVRDFSGEGQIALRRQGERWVGVLRELPLGGMPQGDINGSGADRDTFLVDVTRTDGTWRVRVDLNGDGSLDDETPFGDYLTRRETFTFRAPGRPGGKGPITGAINLWEENGEPRLTIYLDTSGHGTHVAGIAAGHDLMGVRGFDGIAPGAQLLGLKIADNLRGGITTSGSMLRAMEYAADFARRRGRPLIINMSFGIGNAEPGHAVMDSVVDAFLMRHPDVVFAIAAGNEGPGTNTIGLPGSAEFALSVGATYPAAFAQLQFGSARDFLGWWSSRGGGVAKPDLVAPGVAYSLTPDWKTGGEIAGGTSMASPHAAGLATLLVSAQRQEGRSISGPAIIQALRVSARPIPGVRGVDQGAGLPEIERAWQWLRAGREAPRYRVEALPLSGNRPGGGGPNVASATRERMPPAAYRRDAPPLGANAVQRFRVSLVPDSGIARRARRYRLVSDAPFVRPVQDVVTIDSSTGSVVIELRYDAEQLRGQGSASGEVRGIAENDSAAGPAFVLLNTIVTADAETSVTASGTVTAGTAKRWFVHFPEHSGPFAATVSVRDTTMIGSLSLFEPSGQPARGVKSQVVGSGDGLRASAAVSREDLVPGTWEIVLQAMPGKDVVYELNVGPASLAPPPRPALMDTSFVAPINHGLWRQALTVPAGARRMIVETSLTNAFWNSVTDFALTLFDGADGARVGNDAFHFPWTRSTIDLPADRPGAWQAELEYFAGFALQVGPQGEARVHIRFDAGEGGK